MSIRKHRSVNIDWFTIHQYRVVAKAGGFTMLRCVESLYGTIEKDILHTKRNTSSFNYCEFSKIFCVNTCKMANITII